MVMKARAIVRRLGNFVLDIDMKQQARPLAIALASRGKGIRFAI